MIAWQNRHDRPIGDPLLERLERLAARQGRAPAGRTLPPPAAGPAEVLPSSPPHGRPPGPPRTPRRRRHPARGARIGALARELRDHGRTGVLLRRHRHVAGELGTSPASSPRSRPRKRHRHPPPRRRRQRAAATTADPATTAPRLLLQPIPSSRSTATRSRPSTGRSKCRPRSRTAASSPSPVVQYPDDDGKSVRINQRALPELQSEVLTAQSAQVDTVSGATYTSNAYVKSLQSAIDEARAAER